MTRVRVKICCIASIDEAEMAATAGADLLGLVGPMPTGPGIVDLPTARQIADAAPAWSRSVLLTASETADAVVRDAAEAGVDTVQIVRHIDGVEAAKLGAGPLRYIQVVHVEDAGALELIDVYADHCDAFLLDSGRPKEDVLGGVGATHDWNISAEFRRRAPKPVFLAGGLTPDNVGDAIATVKPFGVDLCSGLRPQKALDAGLLAAFMRAVDAAALSTPS